MDIVSLLLEELSSDNNEEVFLNNEMSAFDSDDEEEIGLLMEGGVRPKNENYLRDTVSQYTDTQFREHFRLSRGVAAYLTQIYAASPAYQENSTGGNGKLGAYEQVLIFLWFAGHQTASFRDVADRFNITISSLFRVNIRLIHFISGLAEEVIRWPSRQEQTTIEASFRRKGFPGVVGAIDGTHVRIDKPAVDPDSYCNRCCKWPHQLWQERKSLVSCNSKVIIELHLELVVKEGFY
ncbi:hypothetical protein GE061_000053 [Apolygus lucorum]|uniref:Nuclease HARBI1 n=1 Tax=Apolygus lucorum TaxID=248454 RepID=A0A8S9Y565_APOLU|nr:hypothetical protein GE061_000053 [Apolygus lucorum]